MALPVARLSEVRVRRVPGGVARLPDEPAARRRRPDGVRRSDRQRRAGEHASGPSAERCSWRSIAPAAGQPDERRPSRCTRWPTRSAGAAWSSLISDLLDDPEAVDSRPEAVSVTAAPTSSSFTCSIRTRSIFRSSARPGSRISRRGEEVMAVPGVGARALPEGHRRAHRALSPRAWRLPASTISC